MPQVTNYEITTDIESDQLPTVAPVEVGTATISTHALNTATLVSSGYGIKNNFAAAVNPDITDDSSLSYGVGSRWVNTLLDVSFVCLDSSVGAAIWRQEGTPFVGVKQVPTGLVNGSNVNFTLTQTPITGSLIVLRNGIKVNETDYSFVAPTITFNVAPAVAQVIEAYYLVSATGVAVPVAGNDRKVENRTISAGEITAKKLTLALGYPAAPTEVLIDVRGGSSQIYGIDFIITNSNEVNWNGYSLDGQIIAGSILRIVYEV